MRLLLTGYTGFIGGHLLTALLHAGHTVVCAGRRPPRGPPRPGVSYATFDFASGFDRAAWLPQLREVEVVINAAGVLEGRAAALTQVHTVGPIALFDACVAAGVRRVIQISALGADAGATTVFHLSKRAADEHLRTLPLEHVIVQPSVVYGRGGASAAAFGALASAPVMLLPGDGTQRLQPIHIEDLIEGVVAAIEAPDVHRSTIAFVGPEPMALRDYLASLRSSLGLEPAPVLRVPMRAVRLVGAVGTRTHHGLLSNDSISMLQRGNVADPMPLQTLLRRMPRHPRDFASIATQPLDRREAQLGWLLPLLRYTMAVMWLVSGVVSLGPYPVEASLQLLARTGVTIEWLAYAALYGAAVLDIAFGVAILALRRRRLLWAAQIVVVLAYTAIITVHLPELWLEPFGPVLKNLPVLAGLALLFASENDAVRGAR